MNKNTQSIYLSKGKHSLCKTGKCNQDKTNENKYLYNKKSSDLPYKEKNNTVSTNNSHKTTQSNFQHNNIEASSKKDKAADYSKQLRQNILSNNIKSQNKTPKKAINTPSSSHINENSKLRMSNQKKPIFSKHITTSFTNKASTNKTNQATKNNNIKRTNTKHENTSNRKISNNENIAKINTQIGEKRSEKRYTKQESKEIQTPKGNKSKNSGAKPTIQQNINHFPRKSSKKIEGNGKKDINYDETNNKERTREKSKDKSYHKSNNNKQTLSEFESKNNSKQILVTEEIEKEKEKNTLVDGILHEEIKPQNETKVESIIDEKKQETPITESKQEDLNNKIEIEAIYKKQNDYLNFFKPYYSVDIQKDLIQFSILLYQNEASIDKKPICNDKNDYYEIIIEGKKEKPQQINGEMINIQYGSFIIESEIEKMNKGDNRKYEPEVKADNNGYILVSFTPVN